MKAAPEVVSEYGASTFARPRLAEGDDAKNYRFATHSKRTSLVLELVTRGFLVTSKMGVRSTTSSLRVGYIFMFTPK